MESANRAVPRGALYIGLRGYITYAVYFLTYIPLTRILSPVDIGKMSLLSLASAVFSTVTLFSLDTATTKFVSEVTGTGRTNMVVGVASTALKLVTTLSVPGFLLLVVISPRVSQLVFGTTLDAPILTIAIAGTLIANFTAILVSVLQGLNLFGTMVLTTLVGVISGRAFGILLATAFSLEGFFIGLVLGNIVALAIGLAGVRPHLKRPYEKTSPLTMLVYGYPILFSALVGLVQGWADVTTLYTLTGSLVYTGTYYLGLAGSGILSPITSSFTTVIFPSLSSKHGRGEEESFKAILEVAERAINMLIIPAGFGLAAISGTAVAVAYGRNYLAASAPFAILIASSIITAYQSLMNVGLLAIGRTQPLVKIAAAGAITEVILTAALVIPLAVTGSALARMGMTVVSLLLTYKYIKGGWWSSPDKKQLAKCLTLSLTLAGVLFGFDSFILSKFPIGSLAKLLLDGAAFLILYLGGLMVLKPLRLEDIELLKAAIPPPLHWPLTIIEDRIVQT